MPILLNVYVFMNNEYERKYKQMFSVVYYEGNFTNILTLIIDTI